MAHNTFRLTYTPPLSLSLALLSVGLFAIDGLYLSFQLTPALFVCPGRGAGIPGGVLAQEVAGFNFGSAASYTRLVLHVLGNTSWQSLLTNAVLILLLGSSLEPLYGGKMLALMMTLAALVTGVLTACLTPGPATGADCLVLLLLALAVMADSAQGLPAGRILAIILYLASRLATGSATSLHALLAGNVHLFASLAGAVCGSLPAIIPARDGSRTAAKAGRAEKSAPDKKGGARKAQKPAAPRKSAASRKAMDSVDHGAETVVATDGQ